MKHTAKNRAAASRVARSSMAQSRLNPATLDMLPIGVLRQAVPVFRSIDMPTAGS